MAAQAGVARSEAGRPGGWNDDWRAQSLTVIGRDVLGRSPAALARVIAGEIIPRLLMAHRSDADQGVSAAAGAVIGAADVETFAPLAIELETCALMAHVRTFIARGVSIETVFVELLAPAARMLGEMWDKDRCDFVDVAMGMWRLQEIVHELSAHAPIAAHGGGRRALFAVCPGDQHSLGTVMVEEMFRREGWDTARGIEGDAGELTRQVAGEAFDLVALTVTGEGELAELPALIKDIRRASANPALVVMVGGVAINADPALAARAGADGTAMNGAQAIAKADLLVGRFGRVPSGSA